MPWPRGVPRKGYVTKDGKDHGRLGRRTKIEIDLTDKTVKPEPKSRIPTMRKAVAKPVESGPKKTRKYTTKLAHPQYIIEACPNCEFPEADGGFCPDCGWTRPVERMPANSVHGRTFKR